MTKQEAQQLWQYQVQLRRIAASREAGVEDQIRQEFQRVLQKIQQILSRYYIAFGSNENATMSAGDLRAVGQYQNFLQDVLSGLDGISEPIDREIRNAIENAYTVTYNGMVRGVQQASEGTLALRDALGGLIATTPETVQHIVEHPMDKLKLSTILQRRRSQIISHTKKTLAIGLANGDSYTKMASRIAQSLDGDYKKAMRIVRTEAHRAITRGFEDVAQRTAELTDGSDYIYVKTWRSRGDQKVRDTHRDLNGVTILVTDEFESNGKKALCPCQFGDPSEDINCRCRLVYRFLTREEFLAQGGKLPENSELTDGKNSGTIKKSGAVSGALDPYSDQADNHAAQYYESVRKMKTDVARIAKNTGYSEEFIQSIKNYVFLEKHDLGGKIDYFDPSYMMAQSWQRLIDGKNIQPHDLTLLKHEEMERDLMAQGYSQDEAHRITSKTYNYTEEARSYHDQINANKKRRK